MDKIICDSCNTEVNPESVNPELPERGFVFDFQNGSYYGGFTDSVPFGDEERIQPWKMCHDCMVKFFEVFPSLTTGTKLGTGHHPSPTDKPCCNYCWTLKDGKSLYSDGKGGWATLKELGYY